MDNEIKELIKQVIGNDDPFWNVPVYNVVKKIIELPENTETSISKLVDEEYYDQAMFDINKSVMEVFEKLVIIQNGKRVKIILDKSKHAGQVLGLPYNISFVIKHMIIPDEEEYNIEINRDKKLKCPICNTTLSFLMPSGKVLYCQKCNKHFDNNNGLVGKETTSPYKNKSVLY